MSAYESIISCILRASVFVSDRRYSFLTGWEPQRPLATIVVPCVCAVSGTALMAGAGFVLSGVPVWLYVTVVALFSEEVIVVIWTGMFLGGIADARHRMRKRFFSDPEKEKELEL